MTDDSTSNQNGTSPHDDEAKHLAEIHRWLDAVCEPGGYHELCSIARNKAGVLSTKLYVDRDEMARAALALDKNPTSQGVYALPNPCKPEALTLGKHNRPGNALIKRRRFLQLDFDPTGHEDGQPATAEEQAEALARMTACNDYLREKGWPEPIAWCSGNGGQCVYLINMENNKSTDALIEKIFRALEQFGVDAKCKNAARLFRIPGTTNRKGESTAERPWRHAYTLAIPQEIVAATPAQLSGLAETAEVKDKSSAVGISNPDNLAKRLEYYGHTVTSVKALSDGGFLFSLKDCPFDKHETTGNPWVILSASGAISAGCHKTGCDGRGWPELCTLMVSTSYAKLEGGIIWSYRSHQTIKKQDFMVDTGDLNYLITVPVEGKPNKVIKKNASVEWLGDLSKDWYQAVVYEPGKDKVFNNVLNTWPGFSVANPIKGDVSRWTELLDHVFEGFPSERTYFERWAGYPIKYPGTKLYVAPIIWGQETGCGKSLIGLVLGDVYGEDNFREISQDQLHGGFNEWARHKQFILADEITGADKRMDVGKIKAMITRDRVTVNKKYAPEYTIRDCINYLFTSNEPVVTQITDKDRRHFIHRIEKKFGDERGAATRAWSMSPEGAAALRWHFGHLDYGDFRPNASAMKTAAGDDAVDASRSGTERYCHQRCVDAAEVDPPDADLDVWTREDLTRQAMYRNDPDRRDCEEGAAYSAWGKEGIRNLGQVKVHPGVRDAAGNVILKVLRLRLWTIAHHEYWAEKLKRHELQEIVRGIDRFRRNTVNPDGVKGAKKTRLRGVSPESVGESWGES